MDVPVDETETLLKKGAQALMDAPENDGWTKELIDELLTSEEWARFDSLRKGVIGRIADALDRGVEEELAQAFKDVLNGTSNAKSTAGEYLFLSDANTEDYAGEMEAAYQALTAAHPLLINDEPNDEVVNTSAGGCEVTDQTIDDFFANFDAIREQATGPEFDTLSAPPCGSWGNLAQFTACQIVCSAGGPILYWPCTYLCMCQLCASEFEAIC